ncbi:MAG TPA: hypothetical protein DCL08_07075 [Anaerolineaceae bacterium]|nr:hypothetical protein [Anaerolineaceae bacterium]
MEGQEGYVCVWAQLKILGVSRIAKKFIIGRDADSCLERSGTYLGVKEERRDDQAADFVRLISKTNLDSQ